MAAQRCVNTQCSKFAKRESVYCGTDCIHQHAKDSLRVLNRYDAKRGKAVSTDRHTVNQLLFVCEKFFARFVRALLLQIFFRHRPVFAIYYSCNKKNTGVDIAWLWKVVTAIQFISVKLRNKVVVNNGWFTVSLTLSYHTGCNSQTACYYGHRIYMYVKLQGYGVLVKEFWLSFRFWLSLKLITNNAIVLILILKHCWLVVSNFYFDFMLLFDSMVRYGESPWGRGRQGWSTQALTPHWRVCSSPGCYNTPRLRWCVPNSPAVAVSSSNSTPKLLLY